ncbi:hypothetical protein [Enterococcus sp. BWR-S5]|uniref:hypothetical protein n=1 Tax=Enterococcus sp. BWR-S5 TaxID=2787714 RepID=UPI00192320A4|nr:hypothetical protein [Enterococcus sp. BWR-S5]MBL1227070.1 hypothetical protein [Enterococcus sp. BWR-S5]
MSTKELEDKVSENEKSMKELKAVMEKQIDLVEESVVQYIVGKIPNVLAEYVKNQGSHSNELGIEELKRMKASMNELVRKTPEGASNFLKKYTINELLERDAKLRKEPSGYDPYCGFTTKALYARNINSEIEEYAKNEVGLVANLLENFKYEIKTSYERAYKGDFDVTYRNNKRSFTYNNRTIGNLISEAHEYADNFKKISRLMDENIKLEKQIQNTKAEDIWDSI